MTTRESTPLVSVIISTYNRKDLLKKAIKSVISQSFQDWELLVVDDFSTENVKDMVASFGDDRIRYIRTDKNYGHDSHPKNLGIKEARGEFVSFIDDDDTYRVDALKILYTYIKETEADVVYGDYLIGDSTKGDKKSQGWSVDFNVNLLTRMNYISMCVSMVKRSALLTVGGFDEDVPKFKDWNLWLRLHKSGHLFMHVPIIVTEVSQQVESVSSKYKVEYDAQGNYLPTFFSVADCKIYPDNTCLGTRKPLKVAVYTLTMNRLEYTKQMAKSLVSTADYPFDWLVIDNGSTDGTQDWLKSLPKDHAVGDRQRVVYELNKENVGLAAGWNQAIDLIKKEGKYDIVIKVDNDAEMLTKGWLKVMVELFERNNTIILSPYVEGLEKSPGGVLRQRGNADTPYVMLNDTVLGAVPNLGGICFAHHISLFEYWKFETTFTGNKDYLLSQYARRSGFSLYYMEEYRIWHIDGTTGQHNKFPEYFADEKNTSAVKTI